MVYLDIASPARYVFAMTLRRNKSKKEAFSLVELSIVLVILGLLIGGVLTGQNMIRAAQMRGVTTEYTQYITAMRSFKDKYFGLPGDLVNAAQIWGSAGGNGANNPCSVALITTAARTCSGDGDGLIGPNVNLVDEAYNVFSQLALAGMIEGPVYLNPAGTFNQTPGVNQPGSKAGGKSGWAACYTVHGNYGRGAQNMLTLASVGWTTAPCSMGYGAWILPAEAWNIDTKMDDGIAGSGFVTAEDTMEPTYQNCTTSGFFWSNPATTYVVTNTMNSCRLFFPIK